MIDDLVFRYDRLDAWMEARGLSSAEVADATELSYNYLYMMRLGRRPNVSAVNVAKIALAVGCTMDFLCNVSDDPLGRGNMGGEEEIEMLLAFRLLPMHRKRDVITIAQIFGGLEEDADQKLSGVLDMVRSLFGDAGVEAITGALAGLASTGAEDDSEDASVTISESDVERAIRVGGDRMGADYQSLLDNKPVEDDGKKKRAKKV